MHRTWGSSFMTLPQPIQRRPSTSTLPSTQQSPTSEPPTTLRGLYVASRRTGSNLTSSYPDYFTRTGHTTSTVWGPGALTGKLLKHLGERAMGIAESMVIHTKLNQMDKIQPELLALNKSLSDDEKAELFDQCEKLVELCIVGMRYRQAFMTRALSIILKGFKQPERQTWTLFIAEAISRRNKCEIFEIFQDCFFSLLDESIFRIDGVVDLETLSFRCPAVAHEIATLISHLAGKDQMTSRPSNSQGSSELTLAQKVPSNNADENTDETANIKASFSTVIIRAGFFRLVSHWVEHGMPHWDMRGRERLEVTLQDIANAQIHSGDLEKHSAEAMALIQKLRGRRLLMNNVANEETSGILFEIEEIRQPISGEG